MSISRDETRRDLQRYGIACDEIESVTDEYDRIVSTLYSITADPSKSGCGGPSDKVGSGVAALVDHGNKLADEIRHYVTVRDEVRGVIREVMHLNITYGQCLHYRYVNRWPAYVSAHNMGFSERQERRVHQDALDLAAKVIERDCRV